MVIYHAGSLALATWLAQCLQTTNHLLTVGPCFCSLSTQALSSKQPVLPVTPFLLNISHMAAQHAAH